MLIPPNSVIQSAAADTMMASDSEADLSELELDTKSEKDKSDNAFMFTVRTDEDELGSDVEEQEPGSGQEELQVVITKQAAAGGAHGCHAKHGGRYSKEDTEILEKFYCLGMTGVGKSHLPNIKQVISLTTLNETQIIVSEHFPSINILHATSIKCRGPRHMEVWLLCNLARLLVLVWYTGC